MCLYILLFFFKQKTAYELRISDWSSDVCSSDLMLAFVVWMSFANLFAMAPDLAFEKWTQSVKILLMTFVTMALMYKRERLQALIWIIVRSEERREGKECVRTFRSWWSR